MMVLSQVGAEEKSRYLRDTLCKHSAEGSAEEMASLLLNLHHATLPQKEMDEWLADFLVKGREKGVKLLVKYGANLEQALVIAERIILSQKDELEEKKKEISDRCERIVISCKKIADAEQKPKP
ncbi:MAG: hypothetical protein K8R48_04035 [Alphaproteobacteria bacterium]|nr:hypothetical protein [Alphaproteobacteria bacterium]